MKIKALILLRGESVQADVGDIIDVTDDQALSLIEGKAATFADERPAKPREFETAEAPANRRKGRRR